MSLRALLQLAGPALVMAAVLAGCAAPQIGGPVAPRGAEDAGLLTLPSGRSFPVYPDELGYTGEAHYRWPDGRIYEGFLQDGVPEGMGSGEWPNGERYRGVWHAGERHGHGELSRPDGSRYVGDFVDGQRQGAGVEQSEEGLYRGNWENDLPNGSGEFHGADGATYSGEWLDGYREGFGIYTDVKGNRYEGDWHNDLPDGFGIMHSVNDSVYEGEWRHAERHGYGRIVTEAGVIYEGTWLNDQRHGFGSAERPDGSRYEGEWVGDRRQGFGTERFADGSYHKGTWKADSPHGPGERRDRTGIVIRGVWDDDTVSSPVMRLPSGAEYAGTLLTQRNTAVDPGLLDWLEARAAEDDTWAHFFLGTAYADFTDPAPDLFRARDHFRIAALAGIPDAQLRLALLIVEQAPEEAIEWLQRAARAGQAQANTVLGEYYLTGQWLPVDLPAAIRHLRAGSDAGDMTARNNLAWVLATTRQPELRDAEASLALIRPLALLHGGWRHFDTLAAAYAAAGEYKKAAAAQRRAVTEASRVLGEQSAEVAAMRDRLDQYQAGIPLRQ